MNNLLLRRRALIGGKNVKEILPNGYQQLEKVWFQDQYLIGFSIPISAPFDVEMKIALDVDNFATYHNTNDNNYFTIGYKILAGLNRNFQLGVDYAGHPNDGIKPNRAITYPSMEPVIVEGRFRQSANESVYTIDGVDTGLYRNFTDSTIELLGCVGYCYYLKITQNGTLIHDYVPCVRTSDNQAGVYDVCTDEFIFKSIPGRIMF